MVQGWRATLQTLLGRFNSFYLCNLQDWARCPIGLQYRCLRITKEAGGRDASFSPVNWGYSGAVTTAPCHGVNEGSIPSSPACRSSHSMSLKQSANVVRPVNVVLRIRVSPNGYGTSFGKRNDIGSSPITLTMPNKDLEKRRTYQRIWQRNKDAENRKNSLTILGGKCVLCGNSDYRVLQIDHIKPIRRSKTNPFAREGGTRIRQMIANGTRSKDNLQILCANCHQIKTFSEEDRK